MKRIASLLACLGLPTSMLFATSIVRVGKETGDAVRNWSNPGVVKTQDLTGNNRFGEAGYYQITPGAVGDPWSVAAPDDNDLGLTQFYPTLVSLPAFLSGGPVGALGDYLNLDVSPFFREPSGVDLVRQGSLWLSSDNQTAGLAPGNISGTRISAFTFTLSASASFRLGVSVDTLGPDYNAYAPDYVSVFNTITGEVFSVSLTRDGSPDMVFFDITGNPGDGFEVALWQTNAAIGTGNRVAFALVTFDQLGVSATPTLTYTQADGNIILSWQQNIPGWILESSTDLGVGDGWDPVPSVFNNSVSVSMTGVPKNFFRLRKNP